MVRVSYTQEGEKDGGESFRGSTPLCPHGLLKERLSLRESSGVMGKLLEVRVEFPGGGAFLHGHVGKDSFPYILIRRRGGFLPSLKIQKELKNFPDLMFNRDGGRGQERISFSR